MIHNTLPTSNIIAYFDKHFLIRSRRAIERSNNRRLDGDQVAVFCSCIRFLYNRFIFRSLHRRGATGATC